MKEPSEKAMEKASVVLAELKYEWPTERFWQFDVGLDIVERVAHALDAHAEERFAEGVRAAIDYVRDLSESPQLTPFQEYANDELRSAAIGLRALLPPEPLPGGGG